jgi:Protein of unknown function (DUF3168)
MSSSWALQTAVKAALTADAGVIALAGNPPRVFDAVPVAAARPYLAIADWQTEESDTDDARIDRHSFSVRISSDQPGLKEAKAIAAQVEAALHGAALSLSGYTLVDLAFVAAAFGREADETLSFGEVRFRALTQALT